MLLLSRDLCLLVIIKAMFKELKNEKNISTRLFIFTSINYEMCNYLNLLSLKIFQMYYHKRMLCQNYTNRDDSEVRDSSYYGKK